MARNKTQIVLEKVEIIGMADDGKCIAKPDGMAVFVKGLAPGDVADLKVIKKRKSFYEAIPLKIHQYSNVRTEPFCQHFGVCGGCKWQHIRYEKQLQYKRQQVIDCLTRIGKLENMKVEEIIAAPDTSYYRNKLEYTFSNSRWLTQEEIASGVKLDSNALGFHVPGRFDKVLQIDHCHLQDAFSNQVRNWLHSFALEHKLSFYDIKADQGLLRNLVVRTATTGQKMVILQFGAEDDERIELVMSSLQMQFSMITSLNYIINTKKNDSYGDQEVHHYAGQPHIVEELGALKFIVGPKSFFQTNSRQAQNLYQKVFENCEFTGDENLYDLYTGTGTIANYCAASVQKVIGVEYVEEAIEDAWKNAELNGINNASFYAGDMKDIINPAFVDENGYPDIVITDPPRAGMHGDVIQMLLEIRPKKIVYVSCNPATQARDLALLSEHYAVHKVQPVDMFPQTAHVENIVQLKLR